MMNKNRIRPCLIETDRLILRQFQNGDEFTLFHEYCGDWESSKYLQRIPHQNIDQTKAMLENWAKLKWENLHSEFAWIISDKNNHLAIGILIFIHK